MVFGKTFREKQIESKGKDYDYDIGNRDKRIRLLLKRVQSLSQALTRIECQSSDEDSRAIAHAALYDPETI